MTAPSGVPGRETRRGSRLTPKGRIVLSLGLLALAGALLVGNAPLAAAGVGLLLYLAVGWSFDRNAKLGITRTVAVERTFEGDSVEVEMTVANSGGASSFVEAFDRLPRQFALAEGENAASLNLREGEQETIRYVVTSPVKGHFQIGPVDAQVEDVLGLWSDKAEMGGVAYLTVYPKREPVKDIFSQSKYPRGFLGEHIVRQPGQGTEFFGLRNYDFGDSLRDVNWKASARTPEKLMVNQREKMSVADATLLIDARAVTASGLEGANPFLYQCRAAATAVTFILSRRDRIRYVSYGEGVEIIQPDGGERQLFKVLNHLSSLEPKGTTGAVEAVNAILPVLSRKSPVLLFTSLDGDATLKEAIATLRAVDSRTVVITPKLLEFEGVTTDENLRTLLALDRARTIADLRGVGVRVIEWDPSVSLTQALTEAKLL
ncbi:MAG TPA: DUF58 domain-containing protein [Candidatus Thermoplasmatota archaeon]|nr:DUF58 domain-containing protein [Candidatus Thermoplasmatota archaeon]